MSRQRVDWREVQYWLPYGPCATCKTEAGKPCWRLRTLAARSPVERHSALRSPHKGRPKTRDSSPWPKGRETRAMLTGFELTTKGSSAMGAASMPDSLTATTALSAGPTPGPVVKVVIRARAADLEVEGAIPLIEVYALWERIADRQYAYDRYKPKDRPTTEANAMGFQIEQADEGLHNTLPGGWVR